MGRKVFSLVSHQFRISTYLPLMAKYDILNYGQMADFEDKPPQQDHDCFPSCFAEGKLISRAILQAVVNSVDMSLCTMVTGIIMRRNPVYIPQASLERYNAQLRTSLLMNHIFSNRRQMFSYTH